MTCDHRLWGDPDGLTCTRPEAHVTGHIYKPCSNLGHETEEDQ